jgi:hypothetical protein
MGHSSRRLLLGLIAPVAVLCAACGGGGGSGAVKAAGTNSGAAAGASSAEEALATALAHLSSSSGSSGSSEFAGSSSGGGGGAAAPAGSASAVSLRFVNVFVTAAKQAGPAVDIYDTQAGQAAKPLIAGLAYGAVSGYVHPTASNGVSTFYALPAGEDPVAKQSDAVTGGVLQDDGSHPQETIRVTGEPGTTDGGPLGGLNFASIVEKGTDNGGKAPVAPPPPAGQGEILVDTGAFSGVSATTPNYLLIDSSCAPPLNGDPLAKGVPEIFAAAGPAASNFAEFVTTPGAHQVSVDIEAPGASPTCATLTTKQSTSTVTVAAGQQILAFLYGTSATDAHLAYARVAP